MRTDAKSILGRALVLGLRVMNSFFLLLYFFNLLFPFFLPLFFFISSCYILWFYTISSIHVWVRYWESFFPVSLASS